MKQRRGSDFSMTFISDIYNKNSNNNDMAYSGKLYIIRGPFQKNNILNFFF